jgi:hypothetical protein
VRLGNQCDRPVTDAFLDDASRSKGAQALSGKIWSTSEGFFLKKRPGRKIHGANMVFGKIISKSSLPYGINFDWENQWWSLVENKSSQRATFILTENHL